MQCINFHGHMRPVSGMKYNSDGDLLATCGHDGGVNVIRADTGERIGSFGGHKACMDLAMNKASSFLCVAGMDFKMSIFDISNGNRLAAMEHQAPCRCVGFSHDDRKLFAVTDGKMGQKSSLRLFDLPASLGDGSRSAPIEPKQCNVLSVDDPDAGIMYASYGPTNDKIFFCSGDGSISRLDAETMTEDTCNPMLHSAEVRKMRFDAEYQTIITASKDKTAKLVDARSLKIISTYNNEHPVNDACMAPRADHILLGGGTEARDVTTTDGGTNAAFALKFHHKVHTDVLGQLQCHFGTINCVSFNPKGTGFASGAVDGFVKIHHFDEGIKKSPGWVPVWPEAPADEEESSAADEDA